MPDILIRGMCKLESGKSYRALFKELNGKFVIVLELVESYADREVEIYPVEELPPHGDLIDRDEYVKSECNSCDGSCECVECNCLECEQSCRCDVIVDAMNAPAVIPADKEAIDAD